MLIHELTVAECQEVLARADVGRLACARDGQPYIVPVSISFDSDARCLYGFSTVGKKIEWMRDNPKVCVEVEDISDQFHWTTVVVTGRYVEVEDASASDERRRRAERLFRQRPQWWLPAAAKRASGEEHNEFVIYSIQITEISGRRTARQA